MSDRVPYTYLIGWPEQDIWYYGARYRKGCHPSDLWNPYKTSSKVVKDVVAELGDPPVRLIRRVFEQPNRSRNWESRVLTKLDAANSPRWLNKTNGSPKFFTSSPPSASTREKIGKAHRGRVHTAETRAKLSQAKLGKKHPDDTIRKRIESNRRHSFETREKMSQARKGVPKTKPRTHSSETREKMKASQQKRRAMERLKND